MCEILNISISLSIDQYKTSLLLSSIILRIPIYLENLTKDIKRLIFITTHKCYNKKLWNCQFMYNTCRQFKFILKLFLCILSLYLFFSLSLFFYLFIIALFNIFQTIFNIMHQLDLQANSFTKSKKLLRGRGIKKQCLIKKH